MNRLGICTGLVLLFSVVWFSNASAEDKVLHTFQRKPLTDTYFSERANAGDLNNDGHADVVHGPYWFAGPTFETKHEIFPPVPQNRERYADNFFLGVRLLITSQAAHDFGLSWYEQIQEQDETEFKHHLIMGSHPSENRYGVLFSELHSVSLADVDGDGVKDIIAGKTYYSHYQQSPLWDAGAVVYWFRLVRGTEGVDWIPYKADGEAGIGRQLSVADVNGDGLLDFLVGGMKGAHVLIHKKQTVDETTWKNAQPSLYEGEPLPSTEGAKALRGPKAKFDEKTARVADALEGESLKVHVTDGSTKPQEMKRFTSDKWSGGWQLWWTGGRPGDKLSFPLPSEGREMDLEIVLTCARDYGIVQLALDGEPLGKPIDLYNASVITTGVLTFPKLDLKPGPHMLTVQIAGANPKAVKSFMFALDYVRLVKSQDKKQ